MLRNYLKIGWRNLVKNKLFSLINISGMAISIACFLIISLYIDDELKFDKHVEDLDLKYRVFIDHHTDDGRIKPSAMVPPMFGPTMAAEFPEVDSYVRLMNINSNVLFEVGNKKIAEGKGAYCDPGIFDMFTLALAEGNRTTALKKSGTIAISKTLARKYFGDKPALNEVIEVSDQLFKITAVFNDFSAHSHLQLNYFFSMATLYTEIPERMERWTWQQFHTYVKVRPGTDQSSLEKKLLSMAERYGWPASKPSGFYYVPHVLPMRQAHLHSSHLGWDIAVRGNAQTVYILLGTAIFIIIIAILNFINLSTARAVNRVKEVGIRKVVGAFRSQLIYQFISESVIIAVIALIIGGLVTELTLPSLNTFTEKQIPTGVFLDPALVIVVLLFSVLVGVAAGAYPAFYISGHKPSAILSNKKSPRSGKVILRKALVVLQFIFSFFLITAALVVSNQYEFMRNKDMGFNKDNIIILSLHGEMQTNLETTKNLFLNHPNIISGSLGYGLPGEAYAGDVLKDLENNKDWSISMLLADHDYVKTLGLKLIAGRDFSKDFPSDELEGYILSESAAKLLGYQDPKDALQHKVGWDRWDNQKTKEGKVIGVVKDFHLNSLRENITPIAIQIFPFGYTSLTLRVKGEDLPNTIGHLQSTWKKFNSEWPFKYKFLDENFDKLYKSEEKLAILFTFFTAFTIFVACLGLFGLVVYSTSQKYREISIRKVLGANESSLVLGLTRNYLLLIAIAFVIAIPFSYLAAHQWLQGFAYRIDITPLLFVKAGVVILILAIGTVGIQSLKAARSNPVNALKEQ
jgi:putative ABC transport system permease protein